MSESEKQKIFDTIEDHCAFLFDGVHTPLIVAHPGNAKIVYANSYFWNMLKLNQVDEPVEKITDIIKRGSYADFREEMIEALKEPEAPRTAVMDLSEKLFTQETQHVTLSVLNFNDQEHVSIGFVQSEIIPVKDKELSESAPDDNTDLKLRINELEKLCTEKDTIYYRFAHTMGHELKSPLTAIKGYAELLDYDFEQRDDPETKNIIKIIIKTTERLYAYIESMYHLSLQDLQSRRYKVADVNQIFAGLQEELNSQLDKSQTQLAFENIKARIKTNPVLLREILYQLILSEILYSKVPQTLIRLSFQQQNTKYYFAVVHTLHAAEASAQSIMEIMESSQSDDKDRKSTTIGYEFAKRMIEQAGGKISIERGEDGMNAFYFYLPQL